MYNKNNQPRKPKMSIVIQNRLSNLPKELQEIIYEYARDDSKKKELVRSLPLIYRCVLDYFYSEQDRQDRQMISLFGRMRGFAPSRAEKIKQITPVVENGIVTIKNKYWTDVYKKFDTEEAFISYVLENDSNFSFYCRRYQSLAQRKYEFYLSLVADGENFDFGEQIPTHGESYFLVKN